MGYRCNAQIPLKIHYGDRQYLHEIKISFQYIFVPYTQNDAILQLHTNTFINHSIWHAF